MTECVFFNDTTSQKNWGCYATTYFCKKKIESLGYKIKYNITFKESLNIDELIILVYKIRRDNINFIFINGEGSLYEKENNINARNIILFIYMLENVNCNIYLINTSFNLKAIKNIYLFKKCINYKLKVYIREPVSIRNFSKYYKDIQPIFQPDFLYLIYNEKESFNTNFLLKNNLTRKEYIVIGCSSNYYRPDRKPYNATYAYIKMIKLIKKNTNKEIILYGSSEENVGWLSGVAKRTRVKYFNVNNINWVDAFTLLSNAYLSISGRYHPTIMSLIGLTPSLMITGNNCKMNGLNEMFFKDQKVLNSHNIHNNFKYIINYIKDISKNYDKICNDIDLKLKEYYKIVNELEYYI